MHSGNFNRYFSVYSNRCTQRTEDDRTVRKVLYAYDRDSSLIRVELPEGRTIRYVYDSADRSACRMEEGRDYQFWKWFKNMKSPEPVRRGLKNRREQ